jgi:hypothetical protein
MTEKSYSWGCLTATVGHQPITSLKHLLSNRPNMRRTNNDPLDKNDKDAIYVIGEVGHEVTSKAFYALNAQGKEMVLKMYLKRTNDIGNMLQLEDFNQMALDSTSLEVRNLKKLYTSRAEKFSLLVFNKMQCFAMPFFTPVKKAGHEVALEKIVKVLKQ